MDDKITIKLYYRDLYLCPKEVIQKGWTEHIGKTISYDGHYCKVIAVKTTDDFILVDLGIVQIDGGGFLQIRPYDDYITKFAVNHGLSIAEARERPICKARLAFFNDTGK